MTSSADALVRTSVEVEQARLAALEHYDILDTISEPQFERLVALASRHFNMPMATITFIDEHRQWFKARLGLEHVEGPRIESFCAVTIAQEGVMVVSDAHLDPLLRTYPNVIAAPHLRFYAGAPLVTPEGDKLGTFCVLDQQPRTFGLQEIEDLEAFAAMAMNELRLRLSVRELRHLAITDSLTGLPNRVQYRQALGRACQQADQSGEKVMVGLLDLDRFKSINDTLGHAAGDALLQSVGQRLLEAMATGDLVARMGGDEFSLVLTDAHHPEAMEKMVERLRETFTRPFLLGSREVFIRWSLGFSVYPDDTREAQELLSLADTAMYRAKGGGGGCCSFDPQLDRRATAEVELVAALHHALERNELQVYFQPIVEAEQGAAVAHEALLRWIRPSGLVSPLEFIPAAEASGLIMPIGRWVLRQAAEAVCQRRIQRAAVNLSAIEFQHPAFIQNLQKMLDETGVDPQRLMLELTESRLLEPQQYASVLQEVAALGFRIALDDFGTGYSGINAVASLPMHTLKIDRSFTAEIAEPTAEGRRALGIIRSFVALAEAYNLSIVAEGVETDRQAELLRGVGCTYLQGYLFGRPAPLP